MPNDLLKEITRRTYETKINESPITYSGQISFAEQEPWI